MANVKVFFVVYLTIFAVFRPISAAKREKRDVGTVISIIAEVGPPIYSAIRKYLIKKKCGKKIDSSMVNAYYNNNMANSQTLRDAVLQEMPSAGAAIHMKASGYNCDESYCEEMGPNVTGTLGICSKQYCVCNEGNATMETCGWFKYFDPMNNKCSTLGNSILCH